MKFQKLLASFRLSELQMLLAFVGENKYGRKQEILQRAIAVLEGNPSESLRQKVIELFRIRYPQYSQGNVPDTLYPLLPQVLAQISPVSGTDGDQGNPEGGEACKAPQRGPWQLPAHPEVHLKPLPFYDVHCQGELLKPSSLTLSTTLSRFQENTFTFYITPVQIRLLSDSTRVVSPEEVYGTQVQLRCCLLDTSCEQEDNFPLGINVKVNGKPVPLPNFVPTNKPGVEARRQGLPVNITSHCKLLAMVANQMQVSWNSDPSRNYCVFVNLVKRLSSAILLERLKKFGQLHADYTRALIKEKMKPDPDSEITTTSLRVSLLCPLSKVKMELPCRSSLCKHVQCFDAASFLQMNEKKPTWLCPVCGKLAEFKTLVIDGLLMEVLRECLDAVEIQFSDDGQWKAMSEDDKQCSFGISVDCPKTSTVVATGTDIIDLTKTDSEGDTDTDDDVPLAQYLLAHARSKVESSPDELNATDNWNSSLMTFESSMPLTSTCSERTLNASLDATSPLSVITDNSSTSGNVSIVSLSNSPSEFLTSAQQISPSAALSEPLMQVGFSPLVRASTGKPSPAHPQALFPVTTMSCPNLYPLPALCQAFELNWNNVPDSSSCCNSQAHMPAALSASNQLPAESSASNQLPSTGSEVSTPMAVDSITRFPLSYGSAVPPFSNETLSSTELTLLAPLASHIPLLPTKPYAFAPAPLLPTPAPFLPSPTANRLPLLPTPVAPAMLWPVAASLRGPWPRLSGGTTAQPSSTFQLSAESPFNAFFNNLL